jgi:hypothetical protein
VLHAVGDAFQDGTVIDLSGLDPSRAKNLFAGHIVYWRLGRGDARNRLSGMALDQPRRPSYDSPAFHAVQRRSRPSQCRPAGRRFLIYGEVITKAIAGCVSASGTAKDARACWDKVAHRLPQHPPYVVGTPAAFGFAEWNGRSLTDNAPDVMFSIAANAPIRLGIGEDSVASKPSLSIRSCRPIRRIRNPAPSLAGMDQRDRQQCAFSTVLATEKLGLYIIDLYFADVQSHRGAE